MLPLLLAGLTALCYGGGDFLGGLGSRGSSAAGVLLTAHAASALVLLGLVAVLPPAALLPGDWGWSLVASVCCLAGLLMLYRGLAGGSMAVVSSISAVMTAAVPVGVGVLRGEALRPLGWTGVALGVVATALVSLGAGTRGQHRDPVWLTVLWATGAGLGVGLLLSLVAQTSAGAGVLPLLVVRGVTITCLLAVVAVGSRSLRPSRLLPRRPVHAVGAGVLDIVGTAAFLLATGTGKLAVLGVIVAQYPVVTVALARLALGERVRPWQGVGLTCALAAVTLLTLGA